MRKVLLVFLVLELFLVVFGSQSLAQQPPGLPIKDEATIVGGLGGGRFEEDPTVPITCTTLEANPAGCLLQDFNIRVIGDSNPEHLIQIYKLFSIPGKSSAYRDLIKSSGSPEISVEIRNDGGGCRGWAPSKGRFVLYDFFTKCGQLTKKYLVIHESGHTIAQNHGRLYDLFKAEAYYPKDSSCYRFGNGAWFLKTYAFEITDVRNGLSESFAESLEEYVLYRDWSFRSFSLKDYPTRCNVGYNWERTNIYGGFTF